MCSKLGLSGNLLDSTWNRDINVVVFIDIDLHVNLLQINLHIQVDDSSGLDTNIYVPHS